GAVPAGSHDDGAQVTLSRRGRAHSVRGYRRAKGRGSMVPAMPTGSNGEHIRGLPLREAREVFERDYLIAQISRFSGNISRTAEFVGMERSALHRKLKALGVG